MIEIPANEAKEQLPVLLSQVNESDATIITLHGEPAAALSPVTRAGHDVEQAKEAVRRVREYARQHPIPGLTIEEIKSWVEEGRP